MTAVIPGFGTAVNVLTVLLGSGLGLLLGHRLPQRTRDTVTDGLGLVTLLIGGLSAVEVTSSVLSDAVGGSAPVLIVLGSVLLGGIAGSLLDIERRLAGVGGALRQVLRRRPGPPPPPVEPAETESGETEPVENEPVDTDSAARERFVEGFVTSSLVFCVGPLTILGALNDGLGRGADQLLLKSALDGFAAIAFAASLGVGVMASAVSVAVIQGLLTLLGVLVGTVVPEPHLAAVTATGGLLLVGVGIRLLGLKQVPVGNLLPALLVAPLLVQLVVLLR